MEGTTLELLRLVDLSAYTLTLATQVLNYQTALRIQEVYEVTGMIILLGGVGPININTPGRSILIAVGIKAFEVLTPGCLL